MQEYEELKTIIADIEDDLNKAESGNKAAGTRVRKQMQQIKKVANAVRSKILELRSSEAKSATVSIDTDVTGESGGL